MTASVEAFNIFNSQRPTQLDNRYTQDPVGPIVGATPGTIPTTFGREVLTRRRRREIRPNEAARQGNGNLPKPYTYTDGSCRVVAATTLQATRVVAAVNPAWGQGQQLPGRSGSSASACG